MARPCSADLRDRVLLAHEHGEGGTTALARRFRIGLSPLYLYGLLPLRKRSSGCVHRPVCVPVSGVLGRPRRDRPQRPNGESARASLNRWPATSGLDKRQTLRASV